MSLSGLIPPLTVELARLCKTHCNIYFCRFKENFHEPINFCLTNRQAVNEVLSVNTK